MLYFQSLPNPLQVLEECYRILKYDGLLYLVTIDEDSLMPRLAYLVYKLSGGILKKPVSLLHPIHHVIHFSKKTLLRAMETCGFKVIYLGKGEVPLQSLRWGWITKTVVGIMYFFSGLFNMQYEIRILVCKSTLSK